MNNSSKIIITILGAICAILAGALIYIKVVNHAKTSTNYDLNAKILREMSYVDSNIVSAMNKLNNISMSRYKVYTKTINTRANDESDAEKKGKSTEEESSNPNYSSLSTEDKNSDDLGAGNGKQEESSNNEEDNSNDRVRESSSIRNNSLTETQNVNINWDEIESIYENLYSTWPTLSLDLKNIGVKDEAINNYIVNLDGFAQSINAEDKMGCLTNLDNLYSQITKYVSAITEDENIIDMYNARNSLINAYVLANSENKWEEMEISVGEAESSLNKIINSKKENDRDIENYEKAKIMVENLYNIIELNDKTLFFMQYKNVLQQFETI